LTGTAAFVPWDVAWHEALYGPGGFYRRADGVPAAHFRTSVQASTLLAGALAGFARRCGVSRVVDIGSGRGELLNRLSDADPDLTLVGVDVVARPATLPAEAQWMRSAGGTALPPRSEIFVGALVVAHEWLDDVPCPVVEMDVGGGWRQVEVAPRTGAERLGAAASGDQLDWLARWWPAGAPGSRAEVGLPRDLAWGALVSRAHDSVLVAVDYSHGRAGRPASGTLSGYRRGHAVPAVPDGTCDITAHVALDAVAGAGQEAGANSTVLTTQRQALHQLGVAARRPDASSAHQAPAGYLTDLRLAGEAAELLDPGGLGAFGWLVQSRGVELPTWWGGFDSTASDWRR
jgi:SAM-dependent MidA family methyltransferase